MQTEAQKKHYLSNKEKYKERNKKRREERKQWFHNEVLQNKKCAKCSESDTACLDFHHLNPKEKEGSISNMVSSFRSKEKILKEIEKCIILCSNCHRKLHFYK